jgi:hypothetical protein
MLPDLILYPSYNNAYANVLDDVKEILLSRRLIHQAGCLLERCQLDHLQLESAVRKALRVCITAGLSPEEHFRSVFVYAGAAVQRVWLVSDLGLKLIMLNADISNPIIARMQIELLSNMLNK